MRFGNVGGHGGGFIIHYILSMGLGYEWTLLDSRYLPKGASSVEVQTWRDFFQQLGVSSSFIVRARDVRLARDEIVSRLPLTVVFSCTYCLHLFVVVFFAIGGSHSVLMWM